jgi:hypothetical protein
MIYPDTDAGSCRIADSVTHYSDNWFGISRTLLLVMQPVKTIIRKDAARLHLLGGKRFGGFDEEFQKLFHCPHSGCSPCIST